VVVVAGSCVHDMQGWEWVWAKNTKLSRCGSVFGAPCEAEMRDGA
jgi:hypothetical protein